MGLFEAQLPTPPDVEARRELAALRAEVERLKADIERLERRNAELMSLAMTMYRTR